MNFGAPHCETIKVQMECGNCGQIETELYTPEEMKVNDLTAATGASLRECRELLEKYNYDLVKAEREMFENGFRDLCKRTHCDADEYAQSSVFKKNVAELCDSELKELAEEVWIYAFNSPATITT